MATLDGSPVSSTKLTELGKALDQTSISKASGLSSPLQSDIAVENAATSSVSANKLPTKSPKKRGRTDSLKKMLPAPASQRHKLVTSSYYSDTQDTEEDSTSLDSLHETSLPLQRSQAQPAKLMVKDRRGSGMGVPRAHLILNAVKQAPPAKEKSNPRRWSKHEDESLRLAVERSGERNWKAIADQVPGRNHTQCLQRWTKVLKPGLIKGHWTPEEDGKLRELVAEGKKNWGQVASLIPGRTSKQCRERWCNHLDPNINKGFYTEDEDKIIVEMQAKLGNRWSIIAQQLKGRTEDAVKIRWKSLMRGRRASTKDDKTSTESPGAASDVVESPSSDPEHIKLKAAEASSTRQINYKNATSPMVFVKREQGIVSGNSPSSSSEGAIAGKMVNSVFVKPTQPLAQPRMTAAMGNTMQSVNDLVAASIHNFQMSQRFYPSSAGTALYSGNTNQLMPIGNHQFAMSGNYNVNIQPQQLVLQHPSQLIQQQLMPQSYPLPHGYPMQQQSMGFMPHYVVPTSFSTSTQMPVSTALQRSLSMPLTPTHTPQALAMTNAPYHPAHTTSIHQGFSGAPLHPRTASLSALTGTFSQSLSGTSTGGVSAFSGNVSTSNIGNSPSAANAGAKGLNTPREEWGSSQTPRSQMIMTEGHASAYELFHQQRLRLMLQERDKQGMTLSSAPSPGQALLTKELEANKERQARQAIMHKGWKSAVESMVSFNSVNDLSALEDQQRFDGLLEKVSLSALDPSDEEMLEQAVDIISGDETVEL
ncbi:hypothetical protein CCR75_004217 [Bremia lactucae]|uniref:Uncharacterized protein n=1 Tax=Bremia lactucae TaxID=4779 RepID=A0A976IGN8_BRELC|nr:hypothetical protein CCR75_004217 [Bremia lactucae]